MSRKGLFKIALFSLLSGVIMVPIVAVGFDIVGVAPFGPAIVFLVLSDLPPILIGTPLVVAAVTPLLLRRNLIRWRL
jgi:energy-coupling factor transport system substrate-specific component